MIPCFAYLRVSGLTQADDSRGGLPRQQAAIEQYAALHGYSIQKIFADEGVSGKTDLENRPALRELLSELVDVKVIIIEKLDRLARDLMVSETIMADFNRRGVTLISTCEPDLCSNDPSRKLIRQIMSAIAEYDRALICLRLKAGADRARSQGRKWGGRKPYGKTEQEQSVIQKIRELDLSGMNLTAIANSLNREGFSSRSGKKWHAMQVSRVLEPRSPRQP